VPFPLLVSVGGRKGLIEWQSTGFIGPDKLHGFFLDEPSQDMTFDSKEIIPSIEQSDGIAGQKIRFILADRWLDKEGTEGISMALRANVDFSSFQLRPLLKFFGEAERRVLIADETGLGKTIEAGMILTEILAAKGPDACIVILCPKSVRWKWIWELKTKFGVRAFPSSFKDFKEYSTPVGVHVITHSASREQDSLNILEGSIDLLIIDEIHNFIGRQGNQKRRGRALDLSLASNGVIGLSATPLQLEANDLRLILELIAPGEHTESLWNTQSRIQIAVNEVMAAQKEGKGVKPEIVNLLRENWPQHITVKPDELIKCISPDVWNDIELDIRAIGPIGKRMTRARARDPDVKGANGKSLFRKRIVQTHLVPQGEYCGLIQEIDRFLAQEMHFSNRRQFLSCPAAILQILNKVDSESDRLFELINMVQKKMVNTGPKQEKLFEILNQLKSRDDINRTVIFTHWHPTFFHLKEMISGRFNLFPIHPDLDDKEASEIKNKFADCDDYAILLVTDRMSEGIDLEMANSMVNMDLPYNPAKLQQRIGRLDRYIQESDFIEIHNLAIEDSIEEKQVETLEKRLKVFETMIGSYESVISSKGDEEDWTEDDLDKKLHRTNDLVRLAESSVILRVIDSALDNIIGQKQREIHPIHSNLYLIIKRAMEILGAQASYCSEKGEIKLTLPDRLRKRILESNVFIPWPDGRVRAAFESVDDNGKITIHMNGREATMGPLDPFLIACENLLWGVEGMNSIITPARTKSILGSSDSDNRWTLSSPKNKISISGSEILSKLSSGGMILGIWNSNNSSSISAEVIE
jgi:superfamily II DNA or RNA helicase